MGWLEGVILGLIQGITEILPISSDGHLAVLQYIWRIPESVRVNLTATLHLGTALAIFFFLIGRLKEIGRGIFAPALNVRRESRRWVMLIAIASIPAVVVGIFLENKLEKVFTNISAIGIFFLINGAFIFFSRYAHIRDEQIDLKRVLLIGLIQATAILPAISRSGVTIGLALFLGLSRKQAFDFSFLLALPITFGAAIYELLKVDYSVLAPVPVILGVVVATIVGCLMMNLLKRLVLTHNFYWFGVYCWIAGLAVLIFLR